MWRQWTDENPQEANDLTDNRHPIISRLMIADLNDGKRDRYLGAPYLVYDANDMAYREASPGQPNQRVLIEELNRIEEVNESIRTVVPAVHLLEDHPQSNQQSQLLLGDPPPPPPRPMTPQPDPFGQVVTRAGTVVNPPERYGLNGMTLKLVCGMLLLDLTLPNLKLWNDSKDVSGHIYAY